MFSASSFYAVSDQASSSRARDDTPFQTPAAGRQHAGSRASLVIGPRSPAPASASPTRVSHPIATAAAAGAGDFWGRGGRECSAGGNAAASDIQSLEQEAKQLAADVAQQKVDRQVAQQRAQQLLQRLTEAEAKLTEGDNQLLLLLLLPLACALHSRLICKTMS
ncbi:unnamed protein product, partial [Closterium sp. Naga37s-1]